MMWVDVIKKWDRWVFRGLRLILAVVIGVLVARLPLDFIEYYTYDMRVRTKPVSPVSGRIETVGIDPTTLSTLQKEPEASDHIEFLQNLEKSLPRAVVYLIDPSQVVGSSAERYRLAKMMAEFRNLYFSVNDIPSPGMSDSLRLPEPFTGVRVLPGPTTADKIFFAKDNVSRRLILSYSGAPTIHTFLASTINGVTDERDYVGTFPLYDTIQMFIDFHPRGTYPQESFSEIQLGRFDSEKYRDKIVVVGRDPQDTIKDYVMTPFSRDVLALSNLELHANIFDTVIQNRGVRELPSWAKILITVLLSLLTIHVVLSVRPQRGLVILAASALAYALSSYGLFVAGRVWLPMAHPLLAMFMCYYFFIPYRLIMENRRSWEYFQKNKLLTQVEELKSNFLRMMSHDLKTPLARIQGMAGIVLSDGTPLSETQYRALISIYESSEELSDFIGSILSLGRIESKEIKLQLKSRDVNSLLSEVIKKCEFLARKRRIEILSEFEPMFSFKFDEDLIRQVFTNLIENAIKYSPEGSKILVSTEELDGRAIIQVADQGIGIPTEELTHVFEKFYRSRTAHSGDVAGSGLGLYLVKYFVELHQGFVEVESELEKGSTFTVVLPMLMDAQMRPTPREGVYHV